jgi:hypothetical protein
MAAFMESDALVLCAIAMSSLDRVASLRDLIGTTDHLNAGYATLDEINGAVGRLASADLIDRQAHSLAAGSDARDLLKKNHHLPARLIVPLFQTFLETKSFVRQGDAPVFFSNDEYQTACAEYHRDMKAALRRISKNR